MLDGAGRTKHISFTKELEYSSPVMRNGGGCDQCWGVGGGKMSSDVQIRFSVCRHFCSECSVSTFRENLLN